MTTDVSQSLAGVEATRDEAFRVLVLAVEGALGELGRAPTASEVRLALRQRTYGGFDPKTLGYNRFREFLIDARDRGIVELDMSRRGDISVGLPGISVPPPDKSPPIRSDLWKAFIDWSRSMARYFDTEFDRAVMLPREPAPLEPQRFQELRRRIQAAPDRFVAIEPVTMKMQLGWMQEFADTTSDPSLRELLTKALAGDKPAKLFTIVLREAPEELRRWHEELRRRVRVQIDRWRASSPALTSVSIDRTDSPQEEFGRQQHDLSDAETVERALDFSALLSSLKRSTTRITLDAIGNRTREASEDSDKEIRNRLRAAIDKMPLEELKAIRIPIGYLFEG